MKIATEEEMKVASEIPIKDKLIPYHNLEYNKQIELKGQFLKDVYVKLGK